MVPQDVPQLQLAAAAAEALPRTGGGAGLQQLAWRAQAGAGGAAAPGRREPADGEHPVAEIWVRCEADAQTLCAIVLEITGLPENLHGAVAAVENFFTVLERNIPPALGVRLHGSQGKLHGSKRKIGLFYSNEKKSWPDERRLDSCPDGELGATQFLVQDGHTRSGERHQLVGHQMNEQVRHRAVQALEGEPGKVARAGADTTQRHLGHALGGKAGNEAVAQVAHAADVDVAHRVVVSTRKDGEEVEVL